MGFSSGEEEEVMAPRARILGKKKAAQDELMKQLINPVLAPLSPVDDQSIAPSF